VWSNLLLAWAADPIAVFREFYRVLEPGGLLMFSSYGPDTLKELRRSFASSDAFPHVHRFEDMHNLGDMLVAAGYAAPVMDMDMVTLTYADPRSLFLDLRRTGQTNVERARRRGLIGRRAWQRMLAAYESQRRDGRIPATVEIVYGHAWKPNASARGRGGERTATIQFDPRVGRRAR
jgi:malonyl-CoA O-methyltransferase